MPFLNMAIKTDESRTLMDAPAFLRSVKIGFSKEEVVNWTAGVMSKISRMCATVGGGVRSITTINNQNNNKNEEGRGEKKRRNKKMFLKKERRNE